MTTLEVVLSIVTGLGALAWVGNVITTKITAKNNIQLKEMDQTSGKIENLKKTISQQSEKITAQKKQISFLEKELEKIRLKLEIIIPIIEKHLSDTPENMELLKHLKSGE